MRLGKALWRRWVPSAFAGVLIATFAATTTSDASRSADDEVAFRAFRFNHGSDHAEVCRALADEAVQPGGACGTRAAVHLTGHHYPKTSTTGSPSSHQTSTAARQLASSSSSSRHHVYLWDPAMHGGGAAVPPGEAGSVRDFLEGVGHRGSSFLPSLPPKGCSFPLGTQSLRRDFCFSNVYTPISFGFLFFCAQACFLRF